MSRLCRDNEYESLCSIDDGVVINSVWQCDKDGLPE